MDEYEWMNGNQASSLVPREALEYAAQGGHFSGEGMHALGETLGGGVPKREKWEEEGVWDEVREAQGGDKRKLTIVMMVLMVMTMMTTTTITTMTTTRR